MEELKRACAELRNNTSKWMGRGETETETETGTENENGGKWKRRRCGIYKVETDLPRLSRLNPSPSPVELSPSTRICTFPPATGISSTPQLGSRESSSTRQIRNRHGPVISYKYPAALLSICLLFKKLNINKAQYHPSIHLSIYPSIHPSTTKYTFLLFSCSLLIFLAILFISSSLASLHHLNHFILTLSYNASQQACRCHSPHLGLGQRHQEIWT